MITKDNIILLAISIQSWLNYINTISLSNVLAESSVRYPLADFLERRGGYKIILEKVHPKLKDRQIDFTIETEDGKSYVELKVVRNNTRTTAEKQRVFNDLIRLALLAEGNVDCYFIMCGKSDSFVGDFKSISKSTGKIQPRGKNARKPLPKGDYAKWFPFVIDKSKDVNRCNYKKWFDAFEKEYKYQIKDFDTFFVNLQTIQPQGEMQSQTVAIWRITR
ncbi:MAG: hypothetical protein J5644_04830 [Bacteroidales bacterium]|nr:hypothetical protein [Bacteroidales bacterium]